MIESLYILILTSFACSVLGVFLVLRRLSMLADAISHSILLGIVLAFFFVKDLDSIFLTIGAAIFGVITTIAIELLIKTKRVSEDASVGIIFPLFFSIAVILITKYFRNVHLDTDMVLVGEVILAPLHRIDFFGFSLPRALVNMSFVLLINLIFVFITFTKMKISSFDPTYALVSGVAGSIMHYIFMTLVSFTAVASFSSVGVILSIAFFIAPAASAYLISKDLKITILISAIYSIINAALGYFLAIKFNVSMSGMCAFISGLTFLVTIFVCPNGFLTQFYRHLKNKTKFTEEILILHIYNYYKNNLGESKLSYSYMKEHIAWSDKKMKYYLDKLMKKDFINLEDGIYKLSLLGQQASEKIKVDYGIL